MTTLSQAILQAATRWFDETFEGENLLSRMEDMRIIAQAEGFKSACHATLQSELEEVFQLHPDRFEQVASRLKVEGHGFDLTKTPSGAYVNNETRILHEGWKAARSTW